MKISVKTAIVLVFILFSFPQCEKNTLITEKTVLKISDLKITEYEFEKNLNQYKQIYEYNYQKPAPTDSIKAWIEGFIENTYLLAEAYRLGYNNDPDVNIKVNSMTKTIVTQHHGLLYNKLGEKVKNIDYRALVDAYEKSQKQFTIAILKFKDDKDFYTVTCDDSLIANEKDFEKVVIKSKTLQNVTYAENTIILPFWEFDTYQDYLYKLNEGQISKPMYTPWGMYIVKIKNTTNIKRKPFDEAKESLKHNLKFFESNKLWETFRSELFKKTQIKNEDKIINDFYQILTGNSNLKNLNKSNFHDILYENLLFYKQNLNNNYITVNEFIDFYNNILFRDKLDTHETIKAYLKEMVFQHLAYQEAVKMGIISTKKFILDRKNYKNSIVKSYFEKKALLKNFNVTEKMMEEFYNQHQLLFKDGTHAIVTIFSFNSKNDALKSYPILVKNTSDKISSNQDYSTLVEGLKDVALCYDIHYESTEFSSHIREVIFRIDKKQITRPFEIGNEFKIFVKEGEKGTRIKTIDEVKKEIVKMIHEEKLNQNKKNLIPTLKKKYKIKNNINYKIYYTY